MVNANKLASAEALDTESENSGGICVNIIAVDQRTAIMGVDAGGICVNIIAVNQRTATR